MLISNHKSNKAMKKILILTTIVAGFLFTSCDGFLDRQPSTSLSSDGTITSVEDVMYAVNGISYLFTEDRFLYPSEYGIYADLLTNNYEVIDDYGQSSPIARYTITKFDEFPLDAFYYFYKGCADANKALEESEEINDDGIENARGMLYAWRALCHFELARIFCHIPAAGADMNAANSGMIISDQVFAPDYRGTRSTLKELYDQVISDFTKAIGLLDKDNDLGYFTKYSAMALRARAYLYMGNYSEALADAKEVIANSGATLYSINDYTKVWSAEGTSESLFEILQNASYNPQRYAIPYYTSPNGYPEMAISEDGPLYAYMQANPNDVRTKMVESKADANGKNLALWPTKAPGRDGSLYYNNPKIIRLSEVYLIAAEASHYLNNGEAAKYINEIRKNRIVDYENVSSVTIDDILTEYMIEMFEENQIAFAYWRNKKTITNQVGQEIAWDNDRAVFPIPQREIDLNANLVQNKGY